MVQLITANIYYDEALYTPDRAAAILELLTQFGFTGARHLYADALTRKDFVPVPDEWPRTFCRGYGEDDVMNLALTTGEKLLLKEDWALDVCLATFRKHPPALPAGFVPWSVMTLRFPAARIDDPREQQAFLTCMKALITLLHPIAATIDTLDAHVRLMGRSRDRHFVRDQANQVYWGNFWCGPWLQRLPRQALSAIPASSREALDGGLFFTMSPSPLKRQPFLIRRILMHAIHESERAR